MPSNVNESDIMKASWNTEVSEMPQILCVGCGQKMNIEIPNVRGAPDVFDPQRIAGTAICRLCKTGTGFEIKDNTLTYVAGEKSYGSIDSSLSELVKTLYAEAELCFQVGCANGAAAMCRASVEAALIDSGYDEGVLYDKISAAKSADDLNDVEVSLAHGGRLITRDAIHRGQLVTLSDIPSMLSAAVKILNKLAKKSA